MMTSEPVSQLDAPGSEPQVPEFSEVREPAEMLAANRALSSVYDIEVTVTAELGRVEIPIADVLQLTEGTVVELDRPVSAPIDVRAHGVLLARGEVVVVEDAFAVRLTEVTRAPVPSQEVT